MSQLERYVERYGAVAGPKLYHAIRSRSAYMGANARRRAAIARLTGDLPVARPGAVVVMGSEQTAWLPFDDGDRAIAPAN